jgi:hypothetical protein
LNFEVNEIIVPKVPRSKTQAAVVNITLSEVFLPKAFIPANENTEIEDSKQQN